MTEAELQAALLAAIAECDKAAAIVRKWSDIIAMGHAKYCMDDAEAAHKDWMGHRILALEATVAWLAVVVGRLDGGGK